MNVVWLTLLTSEKAELYASKLVNKLKILNMFMIINMEITNILHLVERIFKK